MMRPAGQSQDAVSCALQAPGADDGADAAPSPCEVEMSACKLREAFSQFDTSGDGYLDKAELVKILTRGKGECCSKSEEEAKKKVEQIMSEFDENKDDKLSVEEFVNWWKSHQKCDCKEVEEVEA